jgi:hypothetical protein
LGLRVKGVGTMHVFGESRIVAPFKNTGVREVERVELTVTCGCICTCACVQILSVIVSYCHTWVQGAVSAERGECVWSR